MPDAGYQGEGGAFTAGDDVGENGRGMGGEDRHRQRRADAVSGEQRLERRPLVLGGEPVQGLGVFADVVMDVQEAADVDGSSSGSARGDTTTS